MTFIKKIIKAWKAFNEPILPVIEVTEQDKIDYLLEELGKIVFAMDETLEQKKMMAAIVSFRQFNNNNKKNINLNRSK